MLFVDSDTEVRLVQDINALRDAPASAGEPESTNPIPLLLRVASVALDISSVYALVLLIAGLWVRASLVTDACGHLSHRRLRDAPEWILFAAPLA